ncbi:MAG: molybdopterin cofactor-binding domain-containing protein [Pseudomonadota bacterium]
MNKWTRRGLIGAGLAAGGVMVLGVAVRPGHRAPKMAELVTSNGEKLLNLWVKIAPDNSITAIVPHSEMGQGAQTALAQMLGDELDADWSQIRVEEAPPHKEYANHILAKGFLIGDKKIPAVLLPTIDGALLEVSQLFNLQITGGSTSVRSTGQFGMRVAGAAAREMLLQAASSAWETPIDALRTEAGYIVSGSQRAPYADFAAAAAKIKPPVAPKLKSPDDFTLMGRSMPRFDVPEKTDGSAQFGIDAHVEGLLYATIQQSPVFGSQVASIDDTEALKMPGVRGVVNLGDAVAVVADGYWTAKQALGRVNAQWETTDADSTSSSDVFAQYDRDISTAIAEDNGEKHRALGDVGAAIESAETVTEATYQVPFLAHATMEPLNATARYTEDLLEIWTGTQNPLGYQADVAEAMEMSDDKVRLTNFYMGGGFGRRSEAGVAIQAARLSREVGAPVKLIWSREEDIRQDRYRPAVTSRFVGAVDASGNPVAWQNHYVQKRHPPDAALIPYAIPNVGIFNVDSSTHVPFGPWRSVDHSQQGFFTESFVDELAVAAKRDPFEFRRDLLKDAVRHRTVLETAAEKAGWYEPTGPGEGRGIALQESFGTYVALVVDVLVENGRVSVERIVCAVDPGLAINPDGLTAQMESGIIFGLTAALYGEINIQNGAVKESNFHDYPMLRIDETPIIETHIVNSGHAPGGAGEPGTPVVAPALANAIFAASGVRVRSLPVKLPAEGGFS